MLNKRIGIKITQDIEGEIKKEVIHEVPADELIQKIPLTTNSGISEMVKEILRKIKEN